MAKLISFVHISLDGFVAGSNGEMDWIKVDEEIFDYVGLKVAESDTALYGRVTYEMMEAYWPTAADEPDASKHDIEHSAWYKAATKVVISKSMQGKTLPKTMIISSDISSQINRLKEDLEKDIIIFGSPTATHALMYEDLIDEYMLFVNPVLLGDGIPLFKQIHYRTKLKLISCNIFSSGVVCIRYGK